VLPVLEDDLRETDQGPHPTVPGGNGVVIGGRGGVPVLVVRVSPAWLGVVRRDGQGPRAGGGRAGRAGLGGGRGRGEDDARHGYCLLCLSC
jgi:hypothetical protein